MATPYRYVTPVSARAATGVVAAVYRQSAAELGAAFSPHLSPAPDLHAAAWAALRESQLVGQAPRANKEAVAAAVAVANSCPFCVDAHTALIHATGAHRLADAIARGDTPDDPGAAALVAWAKATRRPAAPEVRTPPLPAELSAEYVGTVLVNHFINRMIDALRPGALLPANPVLARTGRRVAGLALARTARRTHRPGESLPLLAGAAAGTPPAWAGDGPIGAAFAAFGDAAAAGGAMVADATRAVIRARVAAWDGTHPPLGGGWLDEPLAATPATDRPGARLALLAALAPYRITDADVAAWRTSHPSDTDLVRLLAYGAFTAVEHIEAGVTAGFPTVGVDVSGGDVRRREQS
jgi:AhpD family alkylhydroperoxidase